jgi:hypothetical protein
MVLMAGSRILAQQVFHGLLFLLQVTGMAHQHTKFEGLVCQTYLE